MSELVPGPGVRRCPRPKGDRRLPDGNDTETCTTWSVGVERESGVSRLREPQRRTGTQWTWECRLFGFRPALKELVRGSRTSLGDGMVFAESGEEQVREMGGSPQRPKVVLPGYSRGWDMQTKVQNWGNSLGVRIPRGLAEEVGLGAGTEDSLTAKDGELVLRPAVPIRLRLADLLAGVTPENMHASIDTGDAVGSEAF